MKTREPLNCNFSAKEHCGTWISTLCQQQSTILDAHEIASQYCLEIPQNYLLYNQMHPITFLFGSINITKHTQTGQPMLF